MGSGESTNMRTWFTSHDRSYQAEIFVHRHDPSAAIKKRTADSERRIDKRGVVNLAEL